MVVVPSERVEFAKPCSIETLKLEQYFTVRNMGKGNAHNVDVDFIFHDMEVVNEELGAAPKQTTGSSVSSRTNCVVPFSVKLVSNYNALVEFFIGNFSTFGVD